MTVVNSCAETGSLSTVVFVLLPNMAEEFAEKLGKGFLDLESSLTHKHQI